MYKMILVSMMPLLFCSLPANAETLRVPDNKPLTVHLDYIPVEAKPGGMPITLSPNLVEKLLPELKNPRLMTLKDLSEKLQEPDTFLGSGLTFVLRDDFKRDGVAYIAFVGKYDNPERPDANSFIAIISIKGKAVSRELLTKIYRDRISLYRVIQYKPKIDAIGMSFNLASDDCGYMFWSGKEWQFELCQSVYP